MEKIKFGSRSLKGSFIKAFAVTLLIIFALSAATVYGCYRIQKFVLPDSNEVWLEHTKTYPVGGHQTGRQRVSLGEPFSLTMFITSEQADGLEEDTTVEYAIVTIESDFNMLSAKQKLLYRSAGVSIVTFPVAYSIIGIILCALWFYRKKIAPSVQILSEATEHIRNQNLDFEVRAVSQNELGQLCAAFEEMRQTLYENNRQLWRMIEDRQTLLASVAHDLRNPIAIIEAHIEYMQQNIPDGKLSGERLDHTLSNLASATKRLERYTDCIRDLQSLEQIEIRYEAEEISVFLKNTADAFTVIARQQDKKLEYIFDAAPCVVSFDKDIVSRILENVFSNALRYANKKIRFHAGLSDHLLSISIIDDGKGFSEKMLCKKAALFYTEDAASEHTGLGLATSRALCQKHGGSLEISNIRPNGACVKVSVTVKTASS